MRFPTIAILAFTLLAAVLALDPSPAAAQVEDPAELLSSGREAYEAGDWEQARDTLWAYLDATAGTTGPSRLPQAEALYYIALMEPDAAVASRHYETIVQEYPAASVADGALLRLGLLALVDDRTDEAREHFERLRTEYPYSDVQPELSLWVGRSHLVEGDPDAAIESFLRGYTQVKSQDLQMELPPARREALLAEYVWWLASAYREAGDPDTGNQYYTMLTLDYPDSPQAAEARRGLTGEDRRPAAAVARAEARVEAVGERPEREEPVEEEVVPREETAQEEVALRDEPAVEPERGREPPPAEEVRVAPEPEPQPQPQPIPAEVEFEDEREPEFEAPTKFPPVGGAEAWIQVGAFSSASNAADLSQRLKADGFDTKVEVGIVEGRGYYRVRVGPYSLPREDARLAEQRGRLERLGYPARVVSGRE